MLNFYSGDDKKICNLDLSNFNSEKIKYTTLRRSTLIEFFDSGLNIDAATPGLSFTPIKDNFASLDVDDIPVIILLFLIFLLFVIHYS